MTISASFQATNKSKVGQLKSDSRELLPNLAVYLLGRRITCMTTSAIVEAIHSACLEGKKITVANYNVHSFNLSMQLPWFYNFLQNADITHCDGMGILKALQILGLDLPLEYRVSYSILMPQLLEHCNQHGLSIFLLGSKPQNLETAIANLQNEYPNMRVEGHHGYFNIDDPLENEAVIQQINQFKPNLLIVGMGMPIQENWIRLNGNRLNANVMMPGGAVIDRLAGIVSDCPAFISNHGLEWLYRLCREPQRLAARYLLGNPAFLLHVLLAKLNASSLKLREAEPIKVESWEAAEPRKSANSRNSSAPFHISPKRLGEHLIEAGLVTRNHIETALSEQKNTGMRLGEILVRKGFIKQQTLEYFLKNVMMRDRKLSPQFSTSTELMTLLNQ